MAAALLLLALMLLTVALSAAGELFGRPLWLDEYHTLFLARRASVGQIVDDLRRGSDFNPPLLYLMVRALGAVTGGVSEWTLRLVSFGSAWLTMAVSYVVLRHRVGRLPAFAGAIALWGHPLVVYYAFDGRFYAPLLLLSALFAWTAGALVEAPERWTRRAVAAAGAVLLCTIHYFGILVWGLIVGVLLLAPRRTVRPTLAALWPTVAGPLALAACIPVFLGQRASLSVPTWIPPVSLPQLSAFLGQLFAWATTWIVPVAWLALALRRKARGAASHAGRGRRLAYRMRPLLAPLLLPVVLIIFSVAVQPSLVSRYAIPAVLALAPLTAIMVDDIGWPLGAMACLVALASASLSLHQAVGIARGTERLLQAQRVTLTSTDRDPLPVVVSDRHVYYPLAHASPALAARMRYPDVPDSVVAATFPATGVSRGAGAGVIVERDVSRIHQALYGVPRTAALSALRDLDAMFLVGRPTRSFAARWLPGHRVTDLGNEVYLAERARE